MWNGIFITDHEIEFVGVVCLLQNMSKTKNIQYCCTATTTERLRILGFSVANDSHASPKEWRRGWKTVQPDSSVTMDAMAQNDGLALNTPE